MIRKMATITPPPSRVNGKSANIGRRPEY